MLANTRRNTIIFVCILLIAGIFHVLDRELPHEYSTIMFYLYTAAYAGLLLSWTQSVRRRLLPTRARKTFIAAAILMVSFIIIRSFKYRILYSFPTATRYAWYLFYIPFLFIPALFAISCISMSKIGEASDQGKYNWILAPAGLLSALVLTNDLHHMVFVPLISIELFSGDTGTYKYGWLYYCVYACCAAYILLGMAFLLRAFGLRKSWRKIVYPLVFLALIPVSVFLQGLLRQRGLPVLYNLPEIYIFCMIGIFESCIRSRFIPYNDNYESFFAAMDFPAAITNGKLAQVYHTKTMINADAEQLRSAVGTSVYLDKDTVLRGKSLSSGSVFWTESESELNRLNEQISAVNDALGEENALLKAENDLKEKKARLDAQNAVYDRIARDLYPVQKRIQKILDNADPSGPDFSSDLAVCCVYNAYSKRRSSLLLLSEEKLPLRNRELFLSLQESARYLSCCGIDAAAVGESWSEFSLGTICDLYDSFEAVIEAYLPVLKRLTVSITDSGIRIAAEAGTPKSRPEINLPFSVSVSDEVQYITINADTGGVK